MIRVIAPSDDPPRLLFDLGGILVRLGTVDCLWPGWQDEPGQPSFSERWGNSQAVYDYETGRIDSLSDFYQAARAEMGITVSETEFDKVFMSIIGEPYAETKSLLAALRGCYPLMMLSNTNEAHWRLCRDELGLDVFFDKLFLSFEMGVMKPDPAIYEAFLTEVGGNPQNIWYFDDRPENVEAACRLGIRGQVSRGGLDLLRDLSHLKLIEYFRD
jgi:HAD superfamily hydrolase (TIGR01509 family)